MARTERTNEYRGLRAKVALDAYEREYDSGEALVVIVTDLLADTMHLLHREGGSGTFASCLKSAQAHYLAELAQERKDG